MYLPVAALPKPKQRLIDLPSGRAGVRQTMHIMRDFIRKGKTSDSPIRETVLDLIAKKRQKDFLGEVSAVFRFVRDYIRYVKDINGIETLQAPERTLELAAGDCDDKTILLGTMLEIIGHPVRLVAIGFRPNKLSHVYLETKVGTKWVPLEATEPRPLGWEPRSRYPKMIVKV